MTVKDAALVSLDNAQRALSECKNVMQAKKIMDAAEAARIYLARTHASLEAVNHATEIRTLAERQMGEFLATTPKNGGHKFAGGRGHQPPAQSPTLEEMGISKEQSVVAQRLAKVPPEEFEQRLEAGKAAGKLTRESILNPPEVKPRGTIEIIPPRSMKVAVGMRVAQSVIQQIKTINVNDGEFAEALKNIITFCQSRINNRK